MSSRMSRRQVLLTGAGATAAVMAPGLFTPASAAIISRNYLSRVGWQMRRSPRTFNGYGMHNFDPGYYSFRFDNTFWDLCSMWAEGLNSMLANSTVPRLHLDWFGANFVYRADPGSDHNASRAMDLSAIYFTKVDGWDFVDNHISYLAGAGLRQQRRYVAVAASLRVYFPEVLVYAHSGHYDHIHVDNNHPVPASGGLDFNVGGGGGGRDVMIIQLACNWLNSESLAVDGIFGPLTSAAYNRLCGRFGIHPDSPRNSYLGGAQFLQLVCRTGLRDVRAGFYRA